KARISNTELITKTDLGPAEGSMGGNLFICLTPSDKYNGFCRDLSDFCETYFMRTKIYFISLQVIKRTFYLL
ncbi:hypothetical protein, partial [Kaistella pullorum]|uniref:hypothetical protein n=1 Tax=Kaistella pullorum TaxID=2763074 RepID=UPI002044E266